MNIDDMIKSLGIIKKYCTDQYPFSASHDELWAYTCLPMPEEDIMNMIALGWTWEGRVDKNGNERELPEVGEDNIINWICYV